MECLGYLYTLYISHDQICINVPAASTNLNVMFLTSAGKLQALWHSTTISLRDELPINDNVGLINI